MGILACMPGRWGFLRRMSPTFGGGAIGKCCIFRPRQGALEMFGADRATGLSCGQGCLLEEETYTGGRRGPPWQHVALCLEGSYCLISEAYHR